MWISYIGLEWCTSDKPVEYNTYRIQQESIRYGHYWANKWYDRLIKYMIIWIDKTVVSKVATTSFLQMIEFNKGKRKRKKNQIFIQLNPISIIDLSINVAFLFDSFIETRDSRLDSRLNLISPTRYMQYNTQNPHFLCGLLSFIFFKIKKAKKSYYSFTFITRTPILYFFYILF